MFIYGLNNLKGYEYIEIQINKKESTIDELKINDFKHWKEDSIYISFNDIDEFIQFAHQYLGNCIYLNNEEGPIDIYGINFFSKEKILSILNDNDLDKICQEFLEFLKKAADHNGFFVLGL